MRIYRLLAIGLLFSSLFYRPVSAQDLTLPDFGDPSRQYLSISRERQLGAQVRQRLRDQGALIEDVQLAEYLNSVGQRIAIYAEQTANPYTFYWINSSAINAFAAPGGFIGIHSGLLLATQNEDELAGVMAHEIAHVSQRHIARAFADAERLSLPMAAAMLASIALAAASGEAGQAALVGTAALNAQHQINLTRANELEADRIGYRLLSQSGYNPNGLTDFFAYLQRQPAYSGNQIPEFLLTHPLPRNRIADTQNRLDSRPAPAAKPGRSSPDYYLAKARVRVLVTTNTNELIRSFANSLETRSYQDEMAERYGYALALQRAGRYGDATAQIARLRKAAPDRLVFRIAEADLALAQGDRERAWQLFEQSKTLYPDNFSLLIHYGRGLATQGNPRQALQLLEPYLRRRAREPVLFDIYAQAAQRAGDLAATHAALAEYYYLLGDLEGAIQQAEIGLKRSGATPYQQAQLQARLQQFKQEKEP
jgi:predicted Zn-dependent protease